MVNHHSQLRYSWLSSNPKPETQKPKLESRNQPSMTKQSPIKNQQKRFRSLIGLAVFLITFVIFWASPIREITHSKYSMLASETLLKYHTFALDRYSWPELRTDRNRSVYQIESVNGHLFYYQYNPGHGSP